MRSYPDHFCGSCIFTRKFLRYSCIWAAKSPFQPTLCTWPSFPTHHDTHRTLNPHPIRPSLRTSPQHASRHLLRRDSLSPSLTRLLCLTPPPARRCLPAPSLVFEPDFYSTAPTAPAPRHRQASRAPRGHTQAAQGTHGASTGDQGPSGCRCQVPATYADTPHSATHPLPTAVGRRTHMCDWICACVMYCCVNVSCACRMCVN